VPYTPAGHFAEGKNDPAFRTKLAIGGDLAIQARAAGFVFRVRDQDGFGGEPAEAGRPFVMARKPRRAIWATARMRTPRWPRRPSVVPS
jgi:hypothetical protein